MKTIQIDLMDSNSIKQALAEIREIETEWKKICPSPTGCSAAECIPVICQYGCFDIQDQAGAVVDDDELQHQRRAADDPD